MGTFQKKCLENFYRTIRVSKIVLILAMLAIK